ncbi:tripartite tricarboxylate transporter TctB family protein [Paraburkholderia nemoris]|uniref:tripartite tricarboxylate transporter TctB family protein n=1 Tax=Paraburkholderia nemoris TaxID=2793076 RepID=UPI0038BD5B8B
MFSEKSLSKDHYGALLLTSLGIGTLTLGLGYETGTLNSMGAGYIPSVLGALLILVGIVLGISAVLRDDRKVAHVEPGHAASESVPDWRSWFAIVGGVVAFVVLGRYGGLVPAAFASVFVSALGDRESTVRSAGGLAAVLTVFGVVVFHYGLKLPLALFQSAW